MLTNGCVVSGRLTRVEVDGDMFAGWEDVLITGWCQQFPGHTVDARVDTSDPVPADSHFFVAVCARRPQLGNPTYVYSLSSNPQPCSAHDGLIQRT